ncbi:MAG: hypothetical protein HC904_01230 [Blastochloris sp.]|nr:hypothetical protein [Blastochloris sp.]
MQERYWLYRRDNGVYYLQDRKNGKQQSLKTKDRAEAKRLAAGRNQAEQMPALNLAMARTYLLAKSPQMVTRTWGDVMKDKEAQYAHAGANSTLKRWQKVCRSKPWSVLHALPLVETEPDHFLSVLRHPDSGSSTNVWLRILHNYALDMSWLLAAVLPKKRWPKIHYKEKRGITEDEHRSILALAVEGTEEAAYYELLWETGGSQTDIASLDDTRIDWDQRSILYRRMKTQNRGYEFAKVRLGSRLIALLEGLPKQGPLLPTLAAMSLENRAKLFRRRVRALGLKDISLHCYRYAWAERARKA